MSDETLGSEKLTTGFTAEQVVDRWRYLREGRNTYLWSVITIITEARVVGRREAFEEAATICEQHPLYTGPDCADFIRARAASEGGEQ